MTDKDGKKSKKTTTYAYDLLGRVTREKKTGSKDITYTYDSNNNRKTMTVGNKVTAYKYNKNDELLRTDTLNTDTERDSVVLYKYDKNGNQLATVNRYEIPSEKKDGAYIDIDVTLGDNRLNENVVNHYNAENQLIQTLTKNYKVSFTYDAEGLRTGKTVNGKKTTFVWDGDQLVMELDASGKVQKRYIRGNDLIFADKGNGTEKQYYVTDPHGNVVQLTDEQGKVIKTYEYDSFGNEVNPDSKDENPFRYCGEYYDKETEEVYLRARYYEPAVGRFLTRDTYTGEEEEPESLHLYVYCGNDGVNMVDPSGHWKKKIHERITKNAVKKLGKRLRTKYHLKKGSLQYAALLDGSTLPDRLRDGKSTRSIVLGVNLLKNWEWWHGKSRSWLEQLEKEVLFAFMFRREVRKNDTYVLLGSLLHSVEDYYAHSYYVDIKVYKEHPERYKNTAAETYHSDQQYKLKGKLEFDRKKHNKRKDNEKKDFDYRKNAWVPCNFTTNNRIKGAIKESYKYMLKFLRLRFYGRFKI